MTETGITNNGINTIIEDKLFTHFWRTRQVFNDYWQMWLKTGVLDFVCEKLRSEYNVPLLDDKEDYQSIEMPIGDFDTVTNDVHIFYDSWEKKEPFSKELETIVHQLRLHRSAFWFLFERIFYDTPLDFPWEWHALDNEAIYNPLFRTLDTFYLEGFTKSELVEIEKMLLESLERKLGRPPTTNEKSDIHDWCGRLRRKTRTLKWPAMTRLVVEQMKKYKSYAPGRDDSNNLVDNLRQTSDRLVSEIDLPGDTGLTPEAFRQRVRYLYKQFPILHEFVAAQP